MSRNNFLWLLVLENRRVEKKRKTNKADKNTLSLLNEQRNSRTKRQCREITSDSHRMRGVKHNR